MNENNINIKLGQMIRIYREKKGLSQEQLSFHANLHRTYIGQIERAEKNATIKSIEKIAQALEIDIVELFNFSILKK